MKKVKQYHTVETVLEIKYQNRRKRQNGYPKAHMTAQFLTLLYVLKYKVMG